MLLHCIYKVIGRIILENALLVTVRQHSGQYNNAALLALTLFVGLQVKKFSNFILELITANLLLKILWHFKIC